MKIFVFDTETTGFVSKNEKDLNKQPKIIQFAWILWELKDWTFTEEKRVNILINPKTSIPYNSSQVNHIYDVDVKNSPYIEDVIDEIMYYINTPDVIVWHNIEYDEEILKLELKRLWMEYKYTPKQVRCTMKESVDFCKIQWGWIRFKYAKLWELHKKLFNEYFIWAHDAIIDVEATLKCFVELVKINIIQIKENKKWEVMSLF
jgi:DNA polymerase III epsilon subunit-like protein